MQITYSLYLTIVFCLLRISAQAQPLSLRSPESILGIYYAAIHMDCTKFKAPICDYEEGIKYNPDGTFEWMISKDNKMSSKEIGVYEFKNDTVFHSNVVNYSFANASCKGESDCKEVERLKEKGTLENERFKKEESPFTSIVKVQGDGTYHMVIKGKKTVVYRKIK